MNIQILENIIDRFKTENEFDESVDLFSVFSLMQLFKNYDLEYSEIENSILDGGGDGGIDSLVIMIDGKIINTIEEFNDFKKENDNKAYNNTRLSIFISQIKESGTFKEIVWEKLLSLFGFIYEDEELDYSIKPEVKEKLDLINECISFIVEFSNLISISINYISKGDTSQISLGVKAKEDQLIKRLCSYTLLDNINVKYYGCKELREIYNTPPNQEHILKFEKYLEKNYISDEDSSYVVLAKLSNYYQLITNEEGNLREIIFDDNIRHFEGAVTVNKDIMKTLKEDSDTEFWILNNGITILSNEITPIASKRLKINNIQIVNGLQTSFCIYNYFKNNYEDLDDDMRSVLVKIIKVDDENISDKIIKSTNSQTSVKAADLRATDKYQRDIESNFLANGLFYNRRKNYYKNQGKPRAKIYSVANTAQYTEAILFGKPSSARNNPTSLLKKDENYNRIFNKENNINIYRTCCIIYSKSKNCIKAIAKKIDKIKEKYDTSVDIFMLHLTYIMVCLITNNDPMQEKIINFDVLSIDENIASNAIEILLEVIKENAGTNVITLSKSSIFDLSIKKKMVTCCSKK